jgi:transportin-1
MDQIIQFILACSLSDDEVVALEACEFWVAYCDEQENVDFAVLRPYLPQIIPMLMKHMIFSEYELCMLAGEDE